MHEALVEERNIREFNPRPQFPHGDYVYLADSIATEIGVKPTTQQEEDFPYLYSGVFIPEHFRLNGSFRNILRSIESILKANKAESESIEDYIQFFQ